MPLIPKSKSTIYFNAHIFENDSLNSVNHRISNIVCFELNFMFEQNEINAINGYRMSDLKRKY